MQSYFFLPYLGMGCVDSHTLETSGLPVFQSVLGASDHCPMALCSSGSVAVMKLHLRVRGKGYWVWMRESVVDLQFSCM